MVETLGIFGGTFDPPHLGHLILAGEALNQLKLTRVLWVLTPQSPHPFKRQATTLHHRLEMLRRAIENIPEFELSSIEVERTGPYFMIDTINMLHTRYAAARLVLLIGSDLIHNFHAWKGSDELLNTVYAIGVMRRPGDKIDLPTLEKSLPGLTAKLRFIEAPPLEISSSFIRNCIASQAAYHFYVPTGVFDYIQQYKPYH